MSRKETLAYIGDLAKSAAMYTSQIVPWGDYESDYKSTALDLLRDIEGLADGSLRLTTIYRVERSDEDDVPF